MPMTIDPTGTIQTLDGVQISTADVTTFRTLPNADGTYKAEAQLHTGVWVTLINDATEDDAIDTFIDHLRADKTGG